MTHLTNLYREKIIFAGDLIRWHLGILVCGSWLLEVGNMLMKERVAYKLVDKIQVGNGC